MADRLTPEELAAIKLTHWQEDGPDSRKAWELIDLQDAYTDAHPHRAALLRHIEALEQEATKREEGWREHVIGLHDKILTLEQEVERLREALADAENCHRTSDQWRSHYQTKLARLVERLCEECIYWANAPTKKGMDYAAALQAIIVEATGEGE